PPRCRQHLIAPPRDPPCGCLARQARALALPRDQLDPVVPELDQLGVGRAVPRGHGRPRHPSLPPLTTLFPRDDPDDLRTTDADEIALVLHTSLLIEDFGGCHGEERLVA